jgi:AraC-like DNA-binding protein
MAANLPISHHIKALPPAIKAMEAMGFDARDCLTGTGIKPEDLLAPDPQLEFSFEQEFRFHRNLLQLTGDPLLGLKLGKAYTIQTYGLFGYAFMSAPTLRQAMTIVSKYGPLTFTLFRVNFIETATEGVLRFSRQVDIPADLLCYYVDRDVAAALTGVEPDQTIHVQPTGIALAHNGQGQQRSYEQFFGCPISFNAPRSELQVDISILDAPMPLQDAETSAICQQQCQLLLARMSKSSGFINRVRQCIVARPGEFPDIETIAKKLNMTTRTLRRRLSDEDSSYQQILGDVRYQLAREYLATSALPVEEIAAMLGYSSPGNFTHAFKRWNGEPPRAYRQGKQTC